MLSIFAPRNAAEFRRVLTADGALIVVTPTISHMVELVEALGLLSVDAGKDEAVAAALQDRFRQISCVRLERKLQLSHSEAVALTGMGPSAWHVAKADVGARIAALPKCITVTAAVDVRTYAVCQ
jgi:23S rRNA (guanine745-N1)-methyltransferase